MSIELLTIDDIAEYFSLDDDDIKGFMRNKTFPKYYLYKAKIRYWRKDDVHDWLIKTFYEQKVALENSADLKRKVDSLLYEKFDISMDLEHSQKSVKGLQNELAEKQKIIDSFKPLQDELLLMTKQRDTLSSTNISLNNRIWELESMLGGQDTISLNDN